MQAGTATVLVVGAGGLGAPLALALGLGSRHDLILVDDDVVDRSNLPRQILFGDADVGQPKAHAACAALVRRGVAPARLRPVRARLAATALAELAATADVLCDTTDHPATKFLVNDVACDRGRAAVIAGVIRDQGNVVAVAPGGAHACYRCLFEAPPADADSCADAGVLGPRCGEVAALAARAALELAAGAPPTDTLWIFDPGEAAPRALAPRRRAGCPACAAPPERRS